MSYDEDESDLRERLKDEIDRLPTARLRNFERSRSSFWDWITATARRIWDVVVDTVIVGIGKWLWGLLFG